MENKEKPTKNSGSRKYCLVKSFKQHYLTNLANQASKILLI